MKLDVARAMGQARCYGMCEGCGRFVGIALLDPHHRQARGSGGVFRAAAEIANDVRNLLMFCRPCHDKTEHESTWRSCVGLGWRIPKWVDDPLSVPAYLHTVNGTGWYRLTGDGGYEWINRNKYDLLTYEVDVERDSLG